MWLTCQALHGDTEKSNKRLCVFGKNQTLRAELREWFLSFFPFPVMQGAALRFRLYKQDCLCRWDVTEQLSRPDSRAEYTPR